MPAFSQAAIRIAPRPSALVQHLALIPSFGFGFGFGLGFARALALMVAAACLTPLSAALAEEQVTAQDTLIGWLEESDCSLSFDDVVERSLSVEGFAPIDMKDAMDELTRDGSVRRDVNQAFVLVTGARCTGTEVAAPDIIDGSPEEVLVTVLEQNGCEMSQRALFEAALAQGLTRGDIDSAGEGLFSQGALAVGESGLKLTIGTVCG